MPSWMNRIERYGRRLIFVLAAGSVLAAGPAARAQEYPSKPVEWIIPFTAGSGADIFARTLATLMEKQLGQTVVPVNKPGGSTAIGVSYVLGQPADGHVLFSNSSTLSLFIGHKLSQGSSPLQPADIKPVYRIDGLPILLVVPADSPFATLEDFVEFAKTNPNQLKIGGAGRNSTHHFAALNFAKAADLKYAWVPYEGGADSVVALLGKNIDGIFSTFDNVEQHIAAGTLRALAVASQDRSLLPQTPTFTELGYNVEVRLWRGIFVRAGVPEAVVAKLEDAIQKSLADPEWAAFMEKFKLQPFYAGTDEFSTFFKGEVENARVYFGEAQ